jgi:2-phospho-L-lactate transferase/gluconeogenesis factor (CofD/UPF0052 family)
MKKVVIISGGSGSQNIQKALDSYKDQFDITVITNAYDNGKSTGEVRKATNGKLLGPSDVRKNHQHYLENKLRFSHNLSKDEKNLYGEILKLYSYREDFNSLDDLVSKSINFINSLNIKENLKIILRESISKFSAFPKSKLINTQNFSVINAIYAGFSYIIDRKYDLSNAIRHIENIFNIPKGRVIMPSDTNLYLSAKCKSGNIILDEGDIVDWNNENDPIIENILFTNEGEEYIPTLSDKAFNAIKNSDIFIISTGTFWSSIMPTMMHKRFVEAVKSSEADKMILINSTPDKDMIEKSGKEICNLYKEVLGADVISDFDLYIQENADQMSTYSDGFKNVFIDNYCDKLIFGHSYKHLKNKIFNSYITMQSYKNLRKKRNFIFDLDNTLIRKGNYNTSNFEIEDSNFNLIKNLDVDYNLMIVTGNSSNHLKTVLDKYNFRIENFKIFCNGGGTLYENGKLKPINKKYLISNNDLDLIFKAIEKNNISRSLIENRGGYMISIKPLSKVEREDLFKKLKNDESLSDFNMFKNGKTTIDIMKKGYDKSCILEYLNLDLKNSIYIGDEVDSGNDACFKQYMDTINVKNPYITENILHSIYEE